MRTMHLGQVGDDVRAWQHFIVGTDPQSQVIASGTFDQVTKNATQKFQSQVGFTGRRADGVVGPATMGKAMGMGFNLLHDDRLDEDGPNWPPAPKESQLTSAARGSLFGNFAYVAAGTSANPEAITITDGWVANNIVIIDVPQLHGVTGTNGKISVHRLVAPRVQQIFSAWERAGLKDRVLTWGGSWVPRFVRGSRTCLSNHAWGTAFDINVQWNMLGTQPALKGHRGSVRELVQIAHENGMCWGGHFHDRIDGMHFDCFEISHDLA